MERLLQCAGVAVGAFAVGVQFWMNIAKALEQGTGVVSTIIVLLSFFTILTNILVLLVHVAGLTSAGALAFFTRPLVRAVAVVSIVVVWLVYFFVLAQLWNPQGLQFVLDRLQHYLAPAIMVAWWIGWGRSGTLRFGDVPKMLTYPAVYVAAVLIRAPIAGVVPYPFLDYGSLGWPVVARWIALIAIVFVILGALVVRLDRMRPIIRNAG